MLYQADCLFLAIAVVIFGTNFIPVKKIATGDGLFFQLIVCVNIWIVGLAICFARNSFVIHPLPMLGGFLWATGNLCKGTCRKSGYELFWSKVIGLDLLWPAALSNSDMTLNFQFRLSKLLVWASVKLFGPVQTVFLAGQLLALVGLVAIHKNQV